MGEGSWGGPCHCPSFPFINCLKIWQTEPKTNVCKRNWRRVEAEAFRVWQETFTAVEADFVGEDIDGSALKKKKKKKHTCQIPTMQTTWVRDSINRHLRVGPDDWPGQKKVDGPTSHRLKTKSYIWKVFTGKKQVQENNGENNCSSTRRTELHWILKWHIRVGNERKNTTIVSSRLALTWFSDTKLGVPVVKESFNNVRNSVSGKGLFFSIDESKRNITDKKFPKMFLLLRPTGSCLAPSIGGSTHTLKTTDSNIRFNKANKT